MSLTPKQQQFCDEFLIDLNATQAYIRAYGCSEPVARRNASRLLTNVDVQTYVSKLQAERSQRTQITADQVLAEIARLAFANITDVIEWSQQGVTVMASDGLSADSTAAIAEVAMSETQTETGVTRQIKVKMHDKLKALGKLADHLGLNFSLDDMVNAVLAQGYAVASPAQPKIGEADPLSQIEGIN